MIGNIFPTDFNLLICVGKVSLCILFEPRNKQVNIPNWTELYYHVFLNF